MVEVGLRGKTAALILARGEGRVKRFLSSI